MTSTTQEAPPPTSERGYAVDPAAQGWNGLAVRRSTPELDWPLFYDVYEDMFEQDSQVSSVIRAVMLPILRTQYRLDGTGCDPKITQHVASDLNLPVVGQGNTLPAVGVTERFTWREHLAVALEDKLVFGHAVFEQAYRFDAAAELHHLSKLGYRPGRSIVKWDIADDGGLIAVHQASRQGTSTIPLGIERLAVYVNAKKGGNWLGRSMLRPAYKHWLLKDRLMWTQTLTVERNGMGIPDYEAAPNEKSLDAGRELTAAMRAGDESGVSRPNGSKLQLLGVSGALPDTGGPIAYHDEAIAKAVLAHFLNLGASSGAGSYALGAVQGDFFTLGLQATAGEMADTGTQHVVRDLVTANWGAETPAPRIVFDEIGSRADALVNAIAVLVNAQVLKPDAHLETYLRTTLGLPAREAAEVVGDLRTEAA